MIVEGFFEPLIGQLEDEPLEQAIRERIGAKLARRAPTTSSATRSR